MKRGAGGPGAPGRTGATGVIWTPSCPCPASGAQNGRQSALLPQRQGLSLPSE